MSAFAAMRRLLFGISPSEATFARRGFTSSGSCTQQRLEQVGAAFIGGYNLALGQTDAAILEPELQRQTPLELQGFAFEGAAMGMALVDWLTFAKLRRWKALARGAGINHAYMVHVGAGWAAARLPWIRRRLERNLHSFDPLLRWLVIDGFGFHQGYFQPRRYFERQQRASGLSPACLHVFDQGLGRSLWFVAGAQTDRIARQIGQFGEDRRGDLWSGVGLACAYAGGVEQPAIEALWTAAGRWRPQVAQGAAFAAKTRQRAENLTSQTEMACRVLCGTSAEEAAAITDDCVRDLPADGVVPAYEAWRGRIQSHFGRSMADRAAPAEAVQ